MIQSYWTGVEQEVKNGVLQKSQTDANLLFLFFINDP